MPESKHTDLTYASRRDFLRTAAASGVGLAAFSAGIGRVFAQEKELVFWSQLAGSKKAAITLTEELPSCRSTFDKKR